MSRYTYYSKGTAHMSDQQFNATENLRGKDYAASSSTRFMDEVWDAWKTELKPQTVPADDRFQEWFDKQLNQPIYTKSPLEEARTNFADVITSGLGEQRARRLTKMMDKFESRMSDQVELAVAGGADKAQQEARREECIKQTYEHLARLAGTGSGGKQLYDQRTRAMLAENFMYHAADPTTIEQGSTGTCWWESSYAVAFERNAHHMARFVSDIALSGRYAPTAGGIRRQQRSRYNNGGSESGGEYVVRDAETIRISNGRGSRGGNWSIENAHQDSRRSPVCMIIDQIGPAVGGRRGEGRPNSGGHGEAKNILYKLTGQDAFKHGENNRFVDSHEARTFAEIGGFTESGRGHMWSYCMRKAGEHWLVVRNDQYQNRDKVVGVVPVEQLASFLQRGGIRHNSRQYPDYRPDSDNVIAMNWSDKVSNLRPGRNNDPGDDDYSPRRPRFPLIRRFFS